MTEKQLEIARSMAADGRNKYEIAAAIGMHHASVWRVADKIGLPVRRFEGRRVCTSDLDPQAAEILRMWESGDAYSKIGRELGFGRKTVKRWLELRGVEVVPRPAAREKSAQWRGGRMVNTAGYVLVLLPRDHWLYPQTRKSYILEHRLVLSEHLGRVLTDDESVHHINGDRADNRLENLQLRQRHHGPGQQHRCLDCGSHNVEGVNL